MTLARMYALKPSQWAALDKFERRMGDGRMVQLPAEEFRALVAEVRRLRAIVHEGIRSVQEESADGKR